MTFTIIYGHLLGANQLYMNTQAHKPHGAKEAMTYGIQAQQKYITSVTMHMFQRGENMASLEWSTFSQTLPNT